MRRAAIVLFVLLAAAQAGADYKDSYRKGIEALDRKRWDDVARYMREAIGENPTEGERIKLYGLRFETYLPHFYLGAAYLNLGNCEAATKSFETSRSQGAIRNHPKWPELLDGLKSCEGSAPSPKASSPAPTAAPPTPRPGPDPAQVAQAVQAAEGAVASAEESGRAVAQLSADPRLSPLWSREADLGRTETDGRETLAAARAKLDTGRRTSDLALLADAREQATRARERLERVRSAAEKKRESPQPAPTVAPPFATPKPAASEGVTPADLMAGAQAYFAGRYDDAVRLLEPALGLKGRAGVQARLLRAAGRYALFRAGGEKDAVLRRQAADDVAASKQADPSLVPDSAAFSPQFLDFFRAN
jgi:tetratricopeptide (TPR) repeat protein